MSATVASLRRAAAQRLAATSLSAALDARLLTAHLLGVSPNALARHDEDGVGTTVQVALDVLVARRAAGEPVARIVGEKEFYGLAFELGPDTLVPRPDTETIVDAVLAFVRERDSGRSLRILDLGTGSGAILVALLANLSAATGTGVDIAPEAVAVAARNARRHGVEARARFVAGDWADGIGEPFDIVVSNPPYIATGEIAALAPEVRVYDPRAALDGGADGLDAIRAILGGLDAVLAPDGGAFIEIGAGQAEAVGRLATAAGFAPTFRRDLPGIPRVAVLLRGARPPSKVLVNLR